MNKADYSFQDEAVKIICRDFKSEPTSKNLLVLPTGGGKTITAIKVVNELIKNGFFKENEYAIWVTHRKQLKQQAEETMTNDKWIKKFNFDKKLQSILKIHMKDEASKRTTKNDFEKIKLIIIDEAHHAAANTYKSFFDRNLGILGLTATPTRNDDNKLEFDKISYSIKFSDLIRKNVIIKPIFKQIKTNTTIYTKNLDQTETNMDIFNTEDRNQLIADSIFKNRIKYKKVIIFVGSNKHVESLHNVLRKKNKLYNDGYKHIGFIHSNRNELNIDNNEYLKRHKKYESSILVNCKLLNEGYDDPLINTVVMATPTRSILHYMQCIGRVVRNPADMKMDEVYVVEFNDELPNINYRINNSWLFSDISDYLEPQVIEIGIQNEQEYKLELKNIFKEHKVSDKYLTHITNLSNFTEENILLFSSTKTINENTKWIPLIIQEKNREKYVNLFNCLSNNINKYKNTNYEYLLFKKLKLNKDDFFFSNRAYSIDFIEALKQAFDEIKNKIKVERLKYYIFNKVEAYPPGFLEFIKECYNEEELFKQYTDISDEIKYVIKFPLKLKGIEGFYLTNNEYIFLKDLYSVFLDIKNNNPIIEHEVLINQKISILSNIPFPLRFIHSVILMVKDESLIKDTYNLGEKNE